MKIILSAFILVCASIASLAQQPAPPPKRVVVQGRKCVHRTSKRVTRDNPATALQTATSALADFFVGEAKVDVTKDETVVRLAMAQHGSVLIELPANDGPRYIIPGDPEMATIDEKALERNKRAIVVRPGSMFVPPMPNARVRNPAATVTAQMRSGLVVTFLFYPVEDLAQNVHRCVLAYNRDEVVARRRAAGLAVNLDDKGQGGDKATAQPAAPISIAVEPPDDAKPVAPVDKESRESPPLQSGVDSRPKAESESSPPAPTAAPPGLKPEGNTYEVARALASEALARAIKKPGQFKRWTKPVHGLALSIVQQADPKGEFRLVLIAIKNASPAAITLTPGGPDLFVEMLDDRGKPLNIEPVRKLHTEVSDKSGAISSSATLYYAIAYQSPVLGVHQQVKVIVSQIRAAAEPASITLAAIAR
jgi:hypothetical protein